MPGYSGYANLETARAAKDSYGDHIVQLIERAVQTEVAPVQPEADEMAAEGTMYVVQVGAFKSLNNARRLRQDLKSMGVVSLSK